MKKPLIAATIIALCLSLLTLKVLAAENAKLGLTKNKIITYGDKATQEGYFWSGSDAYDSIKGIDNKNITLMYRARGKNPWNTDWILTTATKGDMKGYFSKEDTPTFNTQYQAFFPGDADFNLAKSNVSTTFVRVKIDIAGEETGEGYKISGTVGPSKAGRKILVRIKTKGKGWRTARRLRLDENSKYEYEYKFKKKNGKKVKKGEYFIKVIYTGDMRNKPNRSEILTYNVD